ncbi:MAG: hypothetical protein GXY48_04965 [Methanomicrobiales archaeon]|nr:hypothetical protein [Methanomicrobiales archaeon]
MDTEPVPFAELSRIVDKILEDCDEDVVCIRIRLNALTPEIRDAILTSDLLNAWQVFYYFFEENPGDEGYEILAFTPASALPKGISIGEYRHCNLVFVVYNLQPIIIVSDDLQELRRFSGKGAYKSALAYMDSEE